MGLGKGETQDKEQEGAQEDKDESNSEGFYPEEKTLDKEENEEISYVGGTTGGDTLRSKEHEEKNDDEEVGKTTKNPTPSSPKEMTTPSATTTKNVTKVTTDTEKIGINSQRCRDRTHRQPGNLLQPQPRAFIRKRWRKHQ
jgi:hypothetical protein